MRVYVDGRRLDGAAYLGTRPTFDDGEAVLEVFLFDFDGDLYGRQIEVEFIGFVRADAKFTSAAALQEQMARDVARAGRCWRRRRLYLSVGRWGRRDVAPSPAAGK